MKKRCPICGEKNCEQYKKDQTIKQLTDDFYRLAYEIQLIDPDTSEDERMDHGEPEFRECYDPWAVLRKIQAARLETKDHGET